MTTSLRIPALFAMVLAGTFLLAGPGFGQEAGSCAAQQATIKTLYVFQHNDGGLGQTTDPTRVFSTAVLDLDSDGQTAAHGILTVAHGRVPALLLADPGGTRFTCDSEGNLTEVAVAFEQRRGDLKALMVITLQDPGFEGPRHQARFQLLLEGMEPIEADGAILVVSALDSVGP